MSFEVVLDRGGWRIERNNIGHGDYYQVLIHPGTIERYPSSTWIGVIRPDGRVEPWRPAGYCPRNFGRDAAIILEKACEELHRMGLVSGPCRIKGRRR